MTIGITQLNINVHKYTFNININGHKYVSININVHKYTFIELIFGAY